MNILAAHLNTSRGTEMLFTKMNLADIVTYFFLFVINVDNPPDIGLQNVVYHITLSSLILLQSHGTFCIV